MTGVPGFSRVEHSLKRLGFCLMVTATVWWGIIYGQVMNNTGFPVQRTLPCLLYTSDRCSLAMSLCKDWHFLGIRRYSADLLWIGIAVSALALIFRILASFRDQRRKAD